MTTPDRIDALLAEHFKAEPLPATFAARIAQAVRSTREGLDRLLAELAIEATGRGVSSIRAGGQPTQTSAAARQVADRARLELGEYLNGQRAFFSVPVDLSAAPAFQRQVLEVARDIPFGEVRPYAWVAERIGRPRAVRAVGTALGRNPVPLIVPCHRVLRTDGSLGGYLFGIDVKRRLFELER